MPHSGLRHHSAMRAFEIEHPDPHPTARAAAVRAPAERDPALRERVRGQTAAARLREGFRLAEFAARLRGSAR